METDNKARHQLERIVSATRQPNGVADKEMSALENFRDLSNDPPVRDYRVVAMLVNAFATKVARNLRTPGEYDQAVAGTPECSFTENVGGAKCAHRSRLASTAARAFSP
jgi:hypothetical protein